MQTNKSILALDVGDRRIGYATASSVARIAHPLGAMNNDEAIWDRIREVIQAESIDLIIIGLPRSMEGNETAQSGIVRTFAQELHRQTAIPFEFEDETLTSVEAEAELRAQGKLFNKGDIDALAATYILESYLRRVS